MCSLTIYHMHVNNILYLYCNSSFQKDNLKMRRDGFSTLKKYIEKHITEHRESFDQEHIRDFIDMYVEAEKEESERTSALNRKFKDNLNYSAKQHIVNPYI